MALYRWKPYVPVAQRRRQALAEMNALRKNGAQIQPIEIEGRQIARTFWGIAWCDHLESFSDYANRLPRGRTYVRNGSVCHLAITRGRIEAKVSGSQIYNLCVRIKALPSKKWRAVKQRCAGQIASLLELLQGNLSDHVMTAVTDRDTGLFPLPGEISFDCDCPDWAVMCKHVAAVLYGVGARLDESPELLFQLRGVKHEELVDTDAAAVVTAATSRRGTSKQLAAHELSDVFGIELDAGPTDTPAPPEARKSSKKVKRTGKKRIAGNATPRPARKVAKATSRTKPRKTTNKKKRARPRMTGEELIMRFVRRKGGATTAQINDYWRRQGRGGSADNTLSKLVRATRLRRRNIEGARGSQYTAK